MNEYLTHLELSSKSLNEHTFVVAVIRNDCCKIIIFTSFWPQNKGISGAQLFSFSRRQPMDQGLAEKQFIMRQTDINWLPFSFVAPLWSNIACPENIEHLSYNWSLSFHRLAKRGLKISQVIQASKKRIESSQTGFTNFTVAVKKREFNGHPTWCLMQLR